MSCCQHRIHPSNSRDRPRTNITHAYRHHTATPSRRRKRLLLLQHRSHSLLHSLPKPKSLTSPIPSMHDCKQQYKTHTMKLACFTLIVRLRVLGQQSPIRVFSDHSCADTANVCKVYAYSIAHRRNTISAINSQRSKQSALLPHMRLPIVFLYVH